MTLSKLFSIISIFTFVISNILNAANSFNINDIEAPSTPTIINISNITPTSVDLEWSQSTDNMGVVSYNIYEFNSGLLLVTDGQTLSTTITGLTPFTGYIFSVSASDAAGNESEQGFGAGWVNTEPDCMTTNSWIGNSSRWANDKLNWSIGAIPNECQSVLIDNGATVTAANDVPSNSNQNRKYLVSTFEVGLGSAFSVDPGAEFHVIPSKPGPYSISGTYIDENPDCGDPFFCYCCLELSIVDNTNCWYLAGGDIVIPGTYIISGNILTVTLDQSEFQSFIRPTYRIIDDNHIIELGTDEVLTRQ